MRQNYQLTGYMKNWKHSSMDSDEALRIVLKAFMEIENSGPIYRADNLDILYSLDPYRRKEFQSIRHRLSKLALNCRVDSSQIIESFADILTLTETRFPKISAAIDNYFSECGHENGAVVESYVR